MDAESWKKYVQAVEKYAEEHNQASQSDTPSGSGQVKHTKPPPLATHAEVTQPIAVVCPGSEVDTPLFSAVTRKDLFDGVELDASILETLISGIPLCEDSESENELEQLEVTSSESDQEDVDENEVAVRGYQVEPVD